MIHKLIIVVSIAAAGCGKKKVSANVECEVNKGPIVECNVTQTNEDAKVEVCWDFSVKCENGATLAIDRTCRSINGAIPLQLTLTAEKLKISGPCEGKKTSKVENVTIEGKRAPSN